ncbi:unnamed protein product [Rhizoctonia solani]|uniref:Transmembrane protein n=1 Tax=Rhizoctonia solani TaxID=456999 RepID=A0A8H3HZX0_9AGAM|nr:unnamed protein product [Rhizoctonia solani]
MASQHTQASPVDQFTAPLPRYPKTRVAYDLPPTIKSIQAGWQATFQSSSIIAALFTVIESILLFFFSNIPAERLNPESAGGQALLVFTYLAFFFSLSATFSSLLLTDELGEVQVRAAQRASWLGPPEDLVIHEDPSKLLTHYGVRKSWRPVMWHWFLMLILGYLCVVGQLLVYVWVMAPKAVAIAMSCVASICLLPLLSILPFQ